MKEGSPQCALCPYEWPDRACRRAGGMAPGNCPTEVHPDFVKQSAEEVRTGDVSEFARAASIQEAEGYADKEKGYDAVRPVKPRILEIVEFAKKMDYRRVALIFCIGLRNEASAGAQVLCKPWARYDLRCLQGGTGSQGGDGAGGGPEGVAGIFRIHVQPHPPGPTCQSLRDPSSTCCLGLCVGHDSLVFKYAEAPCTVLAVKDRLLGHNPLAAVYHMEGYYRCLKEPAE